MCYDGSGTPISGEMKTNSANAALTTEIKLHQTDGDGELQAQFLGNLSTYGKGVLKTSDGANTDFYSRHNRCKFCSTSITQYP